MKAKKKYKYKSRKENGKNNTGRPSKYSQILADKICNAISTSNKGLHTLCKQNQDFPAYETILGWRLNNPEFSNKYDKAREEQAQFLADEIIEIADDDIDDEKAFVGINHIQRDKLKVDARKWAASKFAPKRFGDKVDVTSDGKAINPITITIPDNARKK